MKSNNGVKVNYTREAILDSIKFVVENSDYVRINRDNIDKAVELLRGKKGETWLNSNTLGIDGFSEEQKLRYFILCESLNFCYWDSTPEWEIEHRGKWYSGSYGLMHAVAKAVENGYDLSNADFLEKISLEEFDEIFKGTTSIPLLRERFEIVKQLAKELKGIPDLFEAMSARDDIELLNKIVVHFSNFRDISRYKGRDIYFFKRAILLVGDLMLNIEAIGQTVKNRDNMIGCADYKVPQVLRELGILEYAEDLANLVDNKQEIRHDSEMEVEIRANMLQAIELIRERMRESTRGNILEKTRGKYIAMNSVEIDNALWLLSKEPEFKAKARPYHLTRTVCY